MDWRDVRDHDRIAAQVPGLRDGSARILAYASRIPTRFPPRGTVMPSRAWRAPSHDAAAEYAKARVKVNPLDANTVSRQCLLYLALICFAWEIFLAPLRPGGSWVALKALPLLIALPGVWRGKRYTHKWASMLVLAYAGEGLVRGLSETGMSRWLAFMELGLALACFVASMEYLRRTRGGPDAAAGNSIP